MYLCYFKKSMAIVSGAGMKSVTLVKYDALKLPSMITRIVCFFGLLHCLCGICSTPDSALFSSSFEQRVFLQLGSANAPEPVELFMALGYSNENEGIPSKINETVRSLQARTGKFPLSKKLKILYKTVQDEFLEKYTEDAYFNDIFENGNFNCVTASALYAILLSRLNIPYVIKEMPDHVYLIADPDHTGFLIESTLPTKGVVAFDDKFKSSYIEFLYNNKIISADEYMNTSLEELFASHYTSDKTVTLTQLAGIHYYNKGAVLYNKAMYSESLKNYEKAQLLYDSDVIAYMKSNATTNILYQENQNRKYQGKTLAGYVNSSDANAMALQYARDYFNTVTNELVINHPDINAYDAYFRDFAGNIHIADTADFYQTYYTFRGIYLYSIFDYFHALVSLQKAWQVNRENIRTQQLVSEIIAKYLVNDNNYRTGIDSMKVYFSAFPFLKKDNVFRQFMVYCYARTASACYELHDAKQGNEIIQKMESFLMNNPGLEADESNIVHAYAGAGMYYLEKSQYDLAEKYLRKGLQYVPDAMDLKYMLKSIVSIRGDAYVYAETLPDKSGMKVYMNALTYARENTAAINATVSRYLQGTWKMTRFVREGEEVPVGGALILFRLLDNHKVLYAGKGKEDSGTWKYNEDYCILELKNDKETVPLHLIINDISHELIKGVMYSGEVFDQSAEAEFKAVTGDW